MKASDLIYNEIYKGVLAKGGRENMACQYAAMGVEDYRKNRAGRPMQIIQNRIKQAIKAGKEK